MEFGEKLKARRKELGYTQEYVAEKLGVGISAMSKYERGCLNVSQETIQKLAEILRVEPNYFFYDEEEVVDELFGKRKVLFDLSAKATMQDLDKIIKMVEIMTEEEK